MNTRKSKKKAANCLAMTFLFLIAVVLMTPSTSWAEDQVNGNLEGSLQENYDVIPDEYSTDHPAEADAAPHAPAAGGTYLIGTCYSSPLVIPAAAFSSDGYDPDSFFMWFDGGYIRGTSAHYGCVKAPAYLPNGATVTAVYASVYDNDGTYDIGIDLRRVSNATGVMEKMASLSSTGTSSAIRTIVDPSIDHPLIDYPMYSYYVTTCLESSNIRLYSVRIYFDGPS